jgi:hypothetical protein
MTLVVHRQGNGRDVAVVGREFGCLNVVCGGGATKGTVQAGHMEDLRWIEVEQNRYHAAPREWGTDITRRCGGGGRGCGDGGGGDRNTSEMRRLSPKIISGDSRLHKHIYKHIIPYEI